MVRGGTLPDNNAQERAVGEPDAGLLNPSPLDGGQNLSRIADDGHDVRHSDCATAHFKSSVGRNSNWLDSHAIC